MVSRSLGIWVKTIAFVILLLLMAMPETTVLAFPPVQRTVLPNGLVLLVCEEHSLPIVTLQLLSDAGSRNDPQGLEGVADLTARSLLLGTSRHNVSTINEELDFMGASLDAGADQDYAAISFRVLKKDFETGLELFLDSLTQPIFPEEEIKREIEKTLAAIQSSEDQPEVVAENEFQKTLFLQSPYGHPVEGTRESLGRMTREAITQFYRTYYHPNNSVLVAVGDLTAEEVRTRLLPRLAGWPPLEILDRPSKVTFAEGPKEVKIDRSITQANIILGHDGVARSNPDYYVLTTMNYILGGGGFASRLVEEIRNKRGLAYAVTSFFNPGKDPGSFQVVLQTKNATAREAISLSLREMERIKKEMVSERELEGAKKYLTGSFPMRFNTQAKLTQFLSQVEFYGLGLDYPERYPALINSVTREEVLRVAKTYLHPEKAILVVVGNLKEAGME